MKFATFFFKSLVIFSLCHFFACSSTEIKSDVKESKISTEETAPIDTTPVAGWSDKDTYTVAVTGSDVDSAKIAAKHKILQDIVKVRVLNGSRYTDITKISAEFDKPLKEGKVISEKKVSNGVEIYFQIRDENLKEKFERK
ncbi:MAG TPA: hypothetical protein PKX79_04575 [Spirochaetota bacterium]|mgnify:CR=1 FL=1|jgi:hypothetical protein|nr:hypothetical protein [Spirochaetota bacterium]OQA98256.1 MAG: hypothetical protein BWY23_01187 [Spirochaetes bacterium ADurb.Bin218]HOK02208.1 hypothetical protein [Spirochaetota bacterium]HON14957.1 hypothetical protein [Spirochaetota bacterium]HOQ10947.1 hypothetical protein [Spirochaetota bacterium]